VFDPELSGDHHHGAGGREAGEVETAGHDRQRQSERDRDELRRQLETVQAAV